MWSFIWEEIEIDKEYWEHALVDYNKNVLSVFHHDTEGVVLQEIDQIARSGGCDVVADIGCGPGYYTHYLSEKFESVEAIDISARALLLTAKHCQASKNTRLHQVDLANDTIPFEPVAFAICINVLMMADMDERLRAWRAVTNQIAEKGRLLLVLPSFESILTHAWKMTDDELNRGESCDAALSNAMPLGTDASELFQGVYALEGVKTKHYLKREIVETLHAHEFVDVDVRKLSYASGSNEAMSASWDWLVLATRKEVLVDL